MKDARYAELRPEQLTARIDAAPIAYVPWGALEWHSVHLPVGLDGIVAEHFAERAVERTGGVVLPPMYLPITALPHRFSISFGAQTVRAVLDDLLAELARVGFRVVFMLSGHYAQGHELVLIDAAVRALDDHGLLVLVSPPLALVGEHYLDHAGRWETSQLLASRPDLVESRALLRAMREHPAGHVADLGILGELPTSATATGGELAIEQALDVLQTWSDRLLAGDVAALRNFYERRRAAYSAFVERYFRGSYEEAALAWWSDRMARD